MRSFTALATLLVLWNVAACSPDRAKLEHMVSGGAASDVLELIAEHKDDPDSAVLIRDSAYALLTVDKAGGQLEALEKHTFKDYDVAFENRLALLAAYTEAKVLPREESLACTVLYEGKFSSDLDEDQVRQLTDALARLLEAGRERGLAKCVSERVRPALQAGLYVEPHEFVRRFTMGPEFFPAWSDVESDFNVLLQLAGQGAADGHEARAMAQDLDELKRTAASIREKLITLVGYVHGELSPGVYEITVNQFAMASKDRIKLDDEVRGAPRAVLKATPGAFARQGEFSMKVLRAPSVPVQLIQELGNFTNVWPAFEELPAESIRILERADETSNSGNKALESKHTKQEVRLGKMKRLQARIIARIKQATVPPRTSPETGEELFNSSCIACHSTDGSRRIGPSMKGLWGSSVKHSDGTSATVDDAYFREAVLEPGRRINARWCRSPPCFSSMPPYEGQLTEAQIRLLADFVRNLQ